MKASWRVGKIFGADLHLHISLLVLIPYALFAFRPATPADFVRALLLIAAVFACVALHEVGHTGAARLLGYRATSIVLWPLGGLTNFDRRPEKVLPDLLITAAGPLTNLMIFAFLAIVASALYFLEATSIVPVVSRLLEKSGLLQVFIGLAVANLSLFIFNLVPVYPLDGGQIARNLLKLAFGEQRADLILLILGLPAAALLVFAGIIAGDVLVILTGVLLGIAAISLNARLSNGLQVGLLYLFDRASYHLRRYDFDAAVAEYTRAIRRAPNRSGLYTARAIVYIYLEELDAAWADLERALKLDPRGYLALLLRGELYMLRKQRSEALDCYNQAVDLQPKNPIAYFDRGAYYLETGDLAAALREMDKGVELGPGLPIGHVLRSLVRYRLNDLPGSRSDSASAQRYAPQWMLVLSSAFKHTLAGQLDWALDYYALALARWPNAFQAYQGRGDAYLANRRPELAAADYTRAIQLSPRNGELYLRRGQAYAQAGQPGAAGADLRQAVALADRAHIRRQAQALLQRLAPVQPTIETPAPAAIPALSGRDDPPSAGAAPAPSGGKDAPE